MRDINSNFKSEKNSQESTVIRLYTLEDYDGAGSNLRFAEWDEDITFDGLVYTKFPITIDRISENNRGTIDVVNVRISNVSRLIETYLQQYDIRTKTVRIKRVWLGQLADANAYIEDIFQINGISSNDSDVTLTLTSKLDLLEVNLPLRMYTRNYCQWRFKSTECGYAGAESTCNKTKQRCKELDNFSRFGGFPSVPANKVFIG